MAATSIGITNLQPSGGGPGAVAMSPLVTIETDALGGNYGALEHSQSLAGKLRDFDLSASLRAQGFAVSASSVLGSQTVLPLLPPPPQPPLFLMQQAYRGASSPDDTVGYWSIGIGFLVGGLFAFFLYYNGVFCDPYWVKARKEREKLEQQGLLEEEESESEASSSEGGSPKKSPKKMAKELEKFKDVAEIPEFGDLHKPKPAAEKKKGFFGRFARKDAAEAQKLDERL